VRAVHRDRPPVLAALGATLALTAALLAIGPVREAVTAALGGDLDEMRDELAALGAVAGLVLIGIALVHVVVPFPAELPSAAAGFVLGFGIGFPLMVLAWTLSCLAAYALARVAGPPVLERFLGVDRLAKADRMIERGGWPMLLFLRVLPVVPYNLVSFTAGAMRVPVARFTWTTAVGIAPLTALAALLGERLQAPRLDDPVLWAAIAGALLLLGLTRPVGRRMRRL
jgi:uncharacterized membrane protein YdjX (TVP38/TMEM64 family)